MTIHWAILGAGDVAEIKSGPALQKAPGSRLLTVMRRRADRAEDFAHRHGVPRWTTSVSEVLADPEIDAVYVATPPSSHKALAIAALRAGKHVYLEKPMALNGGEAREIEQAATESDKHLVVAHYRRRLPGFVKIGELLSAGTIGAIRLVELEMRQPAGTDLIAKTEENWRLDPAVSGGGLFHDLAPHLLDLMLHWFGPPSECGGASSSPEGDDPACPDRVSGTMRFACGTLFHGLWDFNAAPRDTTDRVTITGSRGRLEFGFPGDRVTLDREGDPPQTFVFDNPPHIQQPMIEAVVALFAGRGPNPCPATDGVEVMRMIDRMATPSWVPGDSKATTTGHPPQSTPARPPSPSR